MVDKAKVKEPIKDSDPPEVVIEKVLGITEEPVVPSTPETPPKPIVPRGPDLSKEAHRERLGVK